VAYTSTTFFTMKKKLKMLMVGVLFIFLIGCAPRIVDDKGESRVLSPRSSTRIEHVIETIDGKEIYFDYTPPNKTWKAVILVHMLGGDKTDWHSFSRALKKEGFGVAALDLRGHGKSQGDWRDFSQSDFIAMKYDVAAAEDFLHKEHVTDISYVGASIGANIVLSAAAAGSRVVLLSPGLEYRGVSISEKMKTFTGKVLLVASAEDTYSAQSAEALAASCQDCELLKLQHANHGTRMLVNNASLEALLMEFLDQGKRNI